MSGLSQIFTIFNGRKFVLLMLMLNCFTYYQNWNMLPICTNNKFQDLQLMSNTHFQCRLKNDSNLHLMLYAIGQNWKVQNDWYICIAERFKKNKHIIVFINVKTSHSVKSKGPALVFHQKGIQFPENASFFVHVPLFFAGKKLSTAQRAVVSWYRCWTETWCTLVVTRGVLIIQACLLSYL